MTKNTIMDNNYHLYVMQLVKAYSNLSERVEQLEAEIKKLRGERECIIIDMKPKKQVKS